MAPTAPAEIFGVSDTLGSIEVGKAATLIMTNGDILDHRTSITNAIIDGREASLDNKHQRLYEQYKARQRGVSLRAHPEWTLEA